SEMLHDKNVVVNKNIFKLKVIGRGLASKIPTGKFLIEGKISDAILIDLIFNKGPMKFKLTIPEGLQSNKLFENINILLNTDYDFDQYFKSQNILDKYNINAKT